MKTRSLIVVILHLIALSVQQQTNNEDKLFETSSEECLKQYNITDLPETLTEKEAGKNKVLQCFIKCLYSKVDFMTLNGEINVNVVLKHMQPYSKSDASNIIDKCKDVKGADLCETAYKFSKCIGDGLRELGPPLSP